MSWMSDIFKAGAVNKGGIVRRSRANVEDHGGLAALRAEVEKRKFHLVQNGDQYIVLCNQGNMRIIC